MLSAVRVAAGKRILFVPHAIRQMARPDRMITTADIRSVIFDGEIIENYPEDARGHSCLMLGFDDGTRAIHLVCSPKDEYLAIITAYLPDEDEWSEDFTQRLRTT
ncbi:MAG: DUF4258 domain-containing protein [Pyrinomonadaceae bacterium]